MRVARAIIDVVRALRRSLPPPREAPYFGLDGAGYDPRVLEAFCARGIFRKYEFALDMGSGFGGRARWLAARSGCRVVGIDPRISAVAGAVLLNHRVHMDAQVMFQVGRPDCLPLRDRIFTHVWIVDVEPHAAAAALDEAFRVLRRGGHVALQCRQSPGVAQLLTRLRAVGFVEIDACEVVLTEVPHAYRVAADRLRVELGRQESTAAAALTASAAGGHTSAQLFARRPA